MPPRKATPDAPARKRGGVPGTKGGGATKYDPRFADAARVLMEKGAILEDLARAFGVVPRTIDDWLAKHPAFKEAVEAGKVAIDDAVEDSLLASARGYDYDEDVVAYDPKTATFARTTVRRHEPKKVAAQIYWLKNRRPDRWRDRMDVQHSADGSFAELLAQAFGGAKP